MITIRFSHAILAVLVVVWFGTCESAATVVLTPEQLIQSAIYQDGYASTIRLDSGSYNAVRIPVPYAKAVLLPQQLAVDGFARDPGGQPILDLTSLPLANPTFDVPAGRGLFHLWHGGPHSNPPDARVTCIFNEGCMPSCACEGDGERGSER